MPQEDQLIKVTAEERVHPAIRKLAGACLALARLQLGAARLHGRSQRDAAADPTAANQLRRSGGEEVSHD